MSAPTRRAVFDCNTLLQAMAAPGGPAGECMARAEGGAVQLFISTGIVDELREVSQRPAVMRQLRLTHERVQRFLIALEATATLMEGFDEPFRYGRDPDDSMYVSLALACGGRLVVSRDKDLLDLMSDANVEGRDLRTRYPTFQVLSPPQFLKSLDQS